MKPGVVEPKTVEQPEPAMEAVEAGWAAKAGAPASSRRTPPQKAAAMPGPDASPGDARAVSEPPTPGEGQSTGAPTGQSTGQPTGAPTGAPTDNEVDLDVPTFLRRGQSR